MRGRKLKYKWDRLKNSGDRVRIHVAAEELRHKIRVAAYDYARRHRFVVACDSRGKYLFVERE